MQQKKISTLTALAFAATLALSACGGGGGGGNGDSAPGSSNPSTDTGNSGSAPDSSSATTGNVSTPQYAPDSVQLAMFNQLNAYRQQCGFPALVDNTILDQATQAHAQYESENNVVTDNESPSNTDFTGATYGDRAVHFGYPSGVSVGGASGGYYSGSPLTADQAAAQLLAEWFGGVYHSGVVMLPADIVGLGEYEKANGGASQVWSAISLTGTANIPNAPLTFPCEGTSGLPYSEVGGEIPTPPNTSGAWGTPVSVVGSLSDVIRLQTATMTDDSGTTMALQILDSATDPNKQVPAYEGAAYPTTPLKPNTKYSVSVSGTVNGAPFSRAFTFTTGNSVG